jgi:hypothetical protein
VSATGTATLAAPPRLTEETLEHHFGRMLPGAAVLALDELSGGVAVGCIDGRRRECVAGAPGGNAGLLVTLLAAWEGTFRQELPGELVERLFGDYLGHFGSFYLHSDRAAQERLAATLGVQAASVDDLVRRGPAHVRPRLLDALTEPAHVGCGHLRSMIEEPDVYGVRPALVRAVVRAFFTRLWDGDERLVLDILDGSHTEGGVARVRAEWGGPGGRGASDGGTAAGVTDVTDGAAATDVGPRPPVLVTACPHHQELGLFVYHPEAVEWLQALHALFLARDGLISARRVPDIIEAQHRLAQRQLDATLVRLAAGLPVFDVSIQANARARTPAEVAVRLQGFVRPRTQMFDARL